MESKLKNFIYQRYPQIFKIPASLRDIFFLLLALPFVVLIRALKFWKIVRFARICGIAIGHMWSPELYLCEKDLGFHKNGRFIDIFYSVRPMISPFLANKWRKCVHLFPNNKLLEKIDRVNRLFPKYEDHVITLNSISSTVEHALGFDPNKKLLGSTPSDFTHHQEVGNHLLMKVKMHITFTPEEEQVGAQALRNLGVPKNTPYICFHCRDAAYRNTISSETDWSYHNFRDASIRNYLFMAEEFSKKGFYMIRMGAAVAEPLNTVHPKIIDYASNSRTEFMDFYLGAHCYFFITSHTGINAIPTLFRTPTLSVNVIPFDRQYAWTSYDVFIYKKLWLRSEKRLLTFHEILSSGIYRYHYTECYDRDDLEIIENTPDEINAAACEIDERLKGTWVETDEYRQLQQRFWEIFKVTTEPINSSVRIGSEFLRQNQGLLE